MCMGRGVPLPCSGGGARQRPKSPGGFGLGVKSGVAQTYAFFAFVCGSLPRRRCERCFAWFQMRVCWSAGNDTRSTGRPLGVIGAWLMVPV